MIPSVAKKRKNAVRQKKWRDANPERAKSIRERHSEKVSDDDRKAYTRAWMAKRRTGSAGPFDATFSPNWQEMNRQYYLEQKRLNTNRRRQEIRAEALRRYGGEIPACYCCGETHPLLLCLDHIHGGGNRERKMEGIRTFESAKKKGWPNNLRVACHSCNVGAHLNGGRCPHQEGG